MSQRSVEQRSALRCCAGNALLSSDRWQHVVPFSPAVWVTFGRVVVSTGGPHHTADGVQDVGGAAVLGALVDVAAPGIRNHTSAHADAESGQWYARHATLVEWPLNLQESGRHNDQAGSAVKHHSLSGVQVVVHLTALGHAGNLAAEPNRSFLSCHIWHQHTDQNLQVCDIC